MKKIKWAILTFAILLSIGSAFATRPHNFGTLYYWDGSGYMPVGQLGVTYVCTSSTSTCTYTYSNGVYTPYNNNSTYTPIGATTPTTKPAPKKDKQ
jgi:hypothetical protein